MNQEPQVFELDPDKAPRMTAIILLACGLLGIGFLLVNVVFTGEDPYYIRSEWEAGDEPVNQRFDIMPNLVRGKHVGEDSEEDEEAKILPVRKPAAKPATNPFSNPLQPLPGVPGMPAMPTLPGAAPAKAPGNGTGTGIATPAKLPGS